MDFFLFVWVGMCILLIVAGISGSIEKKRNEKELEEKKRLANKITEEINKAVKDGTWPFPDDVFYRKCCENNITKLDNEFSIRKAVAIATEVIEKENSDIDLQNCGEYLKKEQLEAFLKSGERIVRKQDAAALRAKKTPRRVDATVEEATFMKRAEVLSTLYGVDKRVEFLTNLVEDYNRKIYGMIKGEEAMRQLAMIYAGQQKKESSWAVIGGLAEGIAGPAAGVMAAANTMANNQKIRSFNDDMRKMSMEVMRGSSQMAGERWDLEEQRNKINAQLNNARYKPVLSKPAAEDIWSNIKIGDPRVKKNPSGVLSVSLPISLKEPFALDVPENVTMVVDGTIKGKVWFEDKVVGDVIFPLPLYGILSNNTVEVTLDAMCGCSVEYDGEYTVKIVDHHNLWIMEA